MYRPVPVQRHATLFKIHCALTNLTARCHNSLVAKRLPVKTRKLTSKGELPFYVTLKYSLACRPKLEAEPIILIPPYRPTPGPITASQT
jgi:hypothetical protein